MNQKPHIPFVEFPVEKLDMVSLLPLIAQANNGLGRYDGALTNILNPNVLLSPLTNNEAILSSRIEGTIASLSEVLEYEAGKKNNDKKKINDIREILNYRHALTYSVQAIKERNISLSLIKELHRILLQDVRGHDETLGQVRTKQNLIGKRGDTIQNARFVPPAPEHLPIALDNFNTLLQNNDIEALVLLAIIHAQFEIIHPFMDGNGRLGRMLIPLFLFERKIINSPSFYMSEILEANDTEYRDRLLAITKNNDWQGWCAFFLNCLIKQAKSNMAKTRSIVQLYEMMKQKFTETTHSPSVIGALDAFFRFPIINSSNFMEVADIKSRETANSILRKLVDENLISVLEKGSGRKPTVYVFNLLLAVADGELDLTQSN